MFSRAFARPFATLNRALPSFGKPMFNGAKMFSTNQGATLGNQKQYSFRSALFSVVVCTVIGGTFVYLERQVQESRKQAVTEDTVIGKPQLGGDWELTDVNGNRVTAKDFRGKYQLIYFGFTFCPDICPQEIEKQLQVLERVEKEVGEDVLNLLFITVDPKRDGVKEMKEFVSEFSPKLIGLTGSEEEIKKVTKLFRVYFNQGIKSGDNDYLIDHSIIHYLMGPTNQFKDFFGKNLTVSEMAEKIIQTIKDDRAALEKKKQGR